MLDQQPAVPGQEEVAIRCGPAAGVAVEEVGLPADAVVVPRIMRPAQAPAYRTGCGGDQAAVKTICALLPVQCPASCSLLSLPTVGQEDIV